MAESVLIPAAVGTLKWLLSLANDQIKDQIKLPWGLKQDLKKLCRRLEIIQALLNDAENRRITSEALMVWLKHLKAATCDAENVLDEFTYEDLRRKIEVQNRKRNKVRDVFTLSDPLSFRFKMAIKMNNVNKLLDEIRKEAKSVGLNPADKIIGPTVEPREIRLTHPFIDDTQVVGREGDVNEVVKMLLGSEGDLPVTAIVGMPGLGKTTVAQLVYKDPDVLKNFGEERIWICVSDNFKVEKLLNEMVRSLLGNSYETPNIEGLVRKLREKLNGKKYMLVLDDVWNTDPDLWEDFRNALIAIGGSKESRVLATTRSMDVVLAMRTLPSCTHELTTLLEDDCWTMFRKRAFAIGGPRETQTLLEIGKSLVAKCKGVPLSIKSLGGLLYLKQDEQEWESIEKSEVWSLVEKEERIQAVLKLSFDHLPSPSLKQCFAYCSIFLKDEVIKKDELILLWMALGYLQSSPGNNVEMEKLGNEYFNTLWRNSLFQEVQFDEYKNIETCKMHDLVHDLALLVSQGNYLTLKANETKNIADVLHLSLFLGKEMGLDFSEEDFGKLRTLFLTGDLPKAKIFCKGIRVLRLVESCVEEMPSSICKDIHLRFIDLSKSSIVKIPNCITKLYNLETLKLPKSPKELPKDFHKLVSLRHLYLEDSNENRKLMPMKIGQLTSLQTLPFFVVGTESGQGIEELGSLSKLKGRLTIYDLQHVKDKEEAEKAKILEKSNLQSLRYQWDNDFGGFDNNHHKYVLEGLKPHRNVKGLEITNFGGRRLAPWMSKDAGSLQNLVKIELRDCKLCEQVPVLGNLLQLEIVEMCGFQSLTCIGLEFYGLDEEITDNCSSSGGRATIQVFPALRELILKDMPQLKEWSDVSSLHGVATSVMEIFPRLQKLTITECPKLISIPAFKGSTSLRRLQIVSCGELTCLPYGVLQPTLEDIHLEDCPKLKTLNPIDETEATLNGSTSLQGLWIYDCPELMCLPQGLLQPTLVDLSLIDCPKLKAPNPDPLRSLTSLRNMWIISCPNWGSCWEKGLVCTTSLEDMWIGEFGEEYRYFPWPSTSDASSPPWSHFASLKQLTLYGWPEVKSLPEQLEHLPALRYLKIVGFSGLESLPECLGNLSSLHYLYISKCPLLEKRCEKGSGEDWHKIAHIPRIEIDGKEI